ncbi:ChrR family anti-sigma-E factor [Ramlibacter sp. AN1015]|uniref:ChrR family anti-sigma-E factor n=1 Tax=Ramlibacter sp. AN1015 TaxID=3133428 RepID=UPI0030BF97D7
MIVHHPPEDLLLALAAGRLMAGQDLVVAAHAERCAECASRMQTFAALGGAMLEHSAPHPMAADALSKTLQQITALPRGIRASAPAEAPPAAWLPAGVAWPACLSGREVTPWRRIGPGRRFARVQLPQSYGASLFLLSIEPGRTLPRHRHEQLELTQVLGGTFADDRGTFGPGDFDMAGADVHHEPVVQPGSACACLTWVDGRLRFDSGIAAAIAHWVGV